MFTKYNNFFLSYHELLKIKKNIQNNFQILIKVPTEYVKK